MVTGRGLRPGRRWRPSVVTVGLLAVASSLVGNLATNTVQVSWRWWPYTVWAAVVVLVVATVAVELARARGEQGPPIAVGPAATTPRSESVTGSGPLLTGDIEAARGVNVAGTMYVDNRSAPPPNGPGISEDRRTAPAINIVNNVQVAGPAAPGAEGLAAPHGPAPNMSEEFDAGRSTRKPIAAIQHSVGQIEIYDRELMLEILGLPPQKEGGEHG